MEVFLNELSAHPLAVDAEAAKKRIITLLETLKKLRPLNFNFMRTSESIFQLELAPGYTITDFFNDPSVQRELKILLRGIIRRPYIEDDNSYEAEIFVLSGFSTKDHAGNYQSPEGLAIAYLYNSPSVSFSGEAHWHTEWLALTISTNGSSITENVINVHSPEGVDADFFQNWLKDLIEGTELNSETNIAKAFPTERFLFDSRAVSDILSWYHNDRRFLVRIRELINDISANPFKGGKGHTETLAGTGGKASKRIVKKDRLVYTFTNEKIVIHQCKGHYNDK